MIQPPYHITIQQKHGVPERKVQQALKYITTTTLFVDSEPAAITGCLVGKNHTLIDYVRGHTRRASRSTTV